ncbi:MAG: beta strand repeat-containing protein [Chthoniobacterales bacterium]
MGQYTSGAVVTITSSTNYNDTYVGYTNTASNNELIIANSGTVLTNEARPPIFGNVFTNEGNVYIGYGGSSNSMVVTNGAQIVSVKGWIGYSNTASNNSVLVTGTGSLWTNSESLTVGAGGAAGNTLTVADGGRVVASEIVVNAGRLQADTAHAFGSTPLITLGGGSGAAATFGFSTGVTISSLSWQSNSFFAPSSGAVLNISGLLTNGSGYGTFDLSDYYTVGTNDVVTFASQSGLNLADLRVASGNTNWSFQTNANAIQLVFNQQVYAGPDLYTGSNSPGNFVDFFAVETNSYNNTYVGYEAAASNNTLTVANAGTLLTNSAGLYVGYEGSGNTMKMANGGTVAVASNSYIGYTNTSSNNSVLVTGSGSTWTNSGELYVGNSGSGNSMVISNGGSVASALCAIGGFSSNNSVLVTGSGSTWTNSGVLYVGYLGSSNSLVISDGGTVASGPCAIGLTSYSSNNSVLVTGAGSLWTNSGDLFIGDAGSGNSLVISNGGKVFNAMGYIGHESSAVGNLVTVTGSNSSWINSGDLYVGYAGQSNRLVISDGGFVSNVNGYDDGVDPTDAYNSVLVTGSGSRWVNSGNLTFGLAGHDNSLVISNGGIVSVGLNSIIGDLATASNNSVLVTGVGSLLTNSADLYVGNAGSGNSLVISNGGRVASGDGIIGNFADSSNNSVLVTGSGSTWSNSESLTVGVSGSGTLTVANGASVVAATGITIASQSGSSGTLNIGRFGTNDTAGTITAPTIAFGSGTGRINFNQSDSTTLTSSISGLGTLQHLGAGTTILTGSNSYTGTTTINAGTLLANNTAGSALGSSSVTVQSGGTLGGNGSIAGPVTIASGGNLTPGSGGAGALSLSNGLTLQSGATTTFVINSAASFTSINILGNSITYGGELVFNIANYTPADGDIFTLFNMTSGATWSGSLFSVTGGSLFFTELSGIWSASDDSYSYQFSQSTGQLSVTVVPEPSTYALLALGALALIVACRRRNSVA